MHCGYIVKIHWGFAELPW